MKSTLFHCYLDLQKRITIMMMIIIIIIIIVIVIIMIVVILFFKFQRIIRINLLTLENFGCKKFL